jgi:regulator of replication initiation timing
MSETRPSKELLNALDQIEKMNHPKLKQFFAPSMDDLKKELSALRAENERLKKENEAFRHWHIRWLHETDPDCRTLEEQEPMHKEHLRFMLENYQTHKRAKALKGGK